MRSRPLRAAALVAALVAGAACGDGGGDAASTTTAGDAAATTTAPSSVSTSTTAAVEPLTILVSNDDGVAGQGVDALVQALVQLPGVEVVVVVPATDQSGTGDRTSAQPPPASEAALLSGYPAVAVAGFPADAVAHALDVVLAGDPPDLVITGINAGQNLGPIIDLSGTVGAARIAARRGLPALAVSQGFGPPFDFAAGVEAVVAWLEANRDSLAPGTVANLNVPTCPAGDPGGLVEVEPALDADPVRALGRQVCDLPASPPAGDVEAFIAGFVTLTEDVGVGA